MPIPESYGLASLLKQIILPTSITEIYTPSRTVELTRTSFANKSSAERVVTVFHKLEGVTGTPGDIRIVLIMKIASQSTELSPLSGRNTGITLQDNDSLWAMASGDSVTLSIYGVPQNTAPLITG